MRNFLLIIGIAAVSFAGCKKALEPDEENRRTVEQMYEDGGYAQGFIMNAYRSIPGYYDNSEYATDDAVTNDRINPFALVATGSWTVNNNPLSVWNQSYGAMQYINLFLANVDSVKFAADQEANSLFRMRMKGEAYGLRAMYMYFLLRAHAGFTEDGQLMGVPIITKLLTVESPAEEYNTPRATFAACMEQLYKDLDSAQLMLPMEYGDKNNISLVDPQFRAVTQNVSVYNRVMGQYSLQLFNGLIARSVRARAGLLAASPAFQHASNTARWDSAANYAAAIIRYKGGANSLPADGGTYYDNRSQIDGLTNGNNPPEIIWRENRVGDNNEQEIQHYPPSQFGNGRMNPTQNLVDAFPMANGYPISSNLSNFDPANPYTGRDPRLAKYIVYNGNTVGFNNPVISTGSGSGSDDGINVRVNSTRTGYYMKKRLRQDVNRRPGATANRNRYYPRIRYTEMYLNYAEAANEAWGPSGTGTNAFSAYDVIKAIRRRAGVGTTNGDAYLEECKNDQNLMRQLIRNERRLELCFESFRFWDLRRWKANLNETARGMDVNASVYTPIVVEPRVFEDYMYYGPIPFSEVLKYSNLKQNRQWR